MTGEQPNWFGVAPQSDGPELPRLMLMILAPLSAAYRMATATSSSLPPVSNADPNATSQSLDSALTGISLTLNATPATPMPSLVSWPIVPLTCVPWPSKSSGGFAPRDVTSYGATMRDVPLPPTSWGAPEYGITAGPSAGWSRPEESLNARMFAVIVRLR